MSRKWRKARPAITAVGVHTATALRTFRVVSTEATEITAAAGEGARPTFRATVYTGGALRLTSFFLPVVVDLASAKVLRQENPALRQHDPDRIIGHTTSVEITAQRIR